MKWLVAIPVYNEEQYLPGVLDAVRRHAQDILVIDDGSTDATPALLQLQPGVRTLTHPENRGYGQSLIDAFAYAGRHGYDWVITLDCDEQHEPARIPQFVAQACAGEADIISGSRYLRSFPDDDEAPPDRRAINRTINGLLHQVLGLEPTAWRLCGTSVSTSPAMPFRSNSGYSVSAPGCAFGSYRSDGFTATRAASSAEPWTTRRHDCGITWPFSPANSGAPRRSRPANAHWRQAVVPSTTNPIRAAGDAGRAPGRAG
jgi:hypothetical protein